MIYVDNAATTRLKPEVLEKMMPYLTDHFGNPSSIYTSGREAKIAVNSARAGIAAALGATESEIFFTGSGSEADNWAIKGVAHAAKGKHLITSAIEHHAVLHCFEYLGRNGYEVTYLPVDSLGLVNPEDLKNAIREDTALISIMTANNEIGTIQPIPQLAAIAREHKIPFHTDAVQAFGHIPLNVNELGVDLLSVSAHKIGGPKGVGALYIRKGTKITQFIHGGAQENGKRASTENVAGIVGFAHAAALAIRNLDENAKKVTELRDYYIKRVKETIPYCVLNGHPELRLPGNSNFSFEFIEGESLLLSLDMKGIEASSGSACTSGSLDPSHVLLAIGLPHEIAHGSLRISFSEDNTKEEVDTIIAELGPIVQRLRDMSPLYEGIKNKA
ncbi:MAG: Cysteine desulfurase [Firmicutes bacterium ADurb.Bin193]|nr:MAG: Cysteine desulfurase [Firmicutes bacterium ADurb.Bin193]